jgi:hypothetical protein
MAMTSPVAPGGEGEEGCDEKQLRSGVGVCSSRFTPPATKAPIIDHLRMSGVVIAAARM